MRERQARWPHSNLHLQGAKAWPMGVMCLLFMAPVGNDGSLFLMQKICEECQWAGIDSCSNSDHDNTSSCVLCDGSFSGTFMPASRIIVSKLCSITCRVFCCFWRSCFSFLAKASSSSCSSCCLCSFSEDGSLWMPSSASSFKVTSCSWYSAWYCLR